MTDVKVRTLLEEEAKLHEVKSFSESDCYTVILHSIPKHSVLRIR